LTRNESVRRVFLVQILQDALTFVTNVSFCCSLELSAKNDWMVSISSILKEIYINDVDAIIVRIVQYLLL
jgi:hypothetical protein